ncbi:hypothetical protein PF003_g17740 [Phytophthora fragariae]|nr:hypothetical protein PF003_g38918 [Phytophthora fragariae]KAE8880447.1 hypothetical protein PF003_g35603 [Phytophthora fragariae]KAE8889081.1 hypothetical protein PF003_g26891 [Phytophthora fragariae]KAE8897788.1 hypothetical protein PF003_g18423 [Phytophthora fragariae]KAE8898729.1 hypothetical protein PF003_g17740 [Phytophthora fragariae]
MKLLTPVLLVALRGSQIIAASPTAWLNAGTSTAKSVAGFSRRRSLKTTRRLRLTMEVGTRQLR